MWIKNWRLCEGSRGPQVFGLQERLWELGLETPKDGQFGPKTREAVCAWQAQRGMSVTGVVEPMTFEKLWQSRSHNFHIGSAQPLLAGDFSQSYLQVSLKSYRLFLYNHRRLVKTYPISIGKPSTPTPEGKFRILELWETSGSSLGTRYLSYSPYRHSIHSLPPGQLPGQANTLGCLQLEEADLQELCQYLQVGTPLVISQKEHLPPPEEESQWTFYYPQKGESIEEICLHFGVGLSQLLAYNGFQRKEEILACTKLLIPPWGLLSSGGADNSNAAEDGLSLPSDAVPISGDDLSEL